MKTFLSLLIVFFLCSCGNDQASTESPSKKYFINTKVNDKDLVQVILLDSRKTELDSVSTNASVYSKFAHGWHPTKDEALIYSGDIGLLTFEIKDNKLNLITTPKEYYIYSNIIRNAKYKQ